MLEKKITFIALMSVLTLFIGFFIVFYPSKYFYIFASVDLILNLFFTFLGNIIIIKSKNKLELQEETLSSKRMMVWVNTLTSVYLLTTIIIILIQNIF